jgi:hypothetical protein
MHPGAQQGLNEVWANEVISNERSLAVFALIFFTYLAESQIKNKFLFIQTNSFIIFTCPNPVLFVLGQPHRERSFLCSMI